MYIIAFPKPAGDREVAPREFDVHSRWLTVYQMSTAHSKVAPGTMYEPLA
jgi:hypothetical protein